MVNESQWLTTAEAVDYLNVHPESLRKWAQDGVIRAAKLENRDGFRFRREELDRFLRERESASGEADTLEQSGTREEAYRQGLEEQRRQAGRED